ncbi:SDR family oxidoreductase [Haloarcula sp. 1CSR25-25]|uniref:SDR family NAD(P)-dependent oxidoreductase n=1 Tax=Haloarcula sp. 1CSR25-25 TaxID=2862545 RepID=UPI0028940C16|nr:SDR family oxidoreductase [Haloarcula sp. 1CSR25-25]MDT3434725.1 SDR family oxidoreductase [Haloarcula sp. 1CSR25-25]
MVPGMDSATAVVTGASRGIGEQIAHAVAEAGAHTVICARDAEALDAVAADIRDAGGSVTAIRADVRDEFDVERLVETATREGDGAIRYVVANAGVYHGTAGETPLTEESYAAFDDHLRTNARGVFSTIREAVPHLGPDARVVVPTGAVARQGMPGYGSYAVSKAAAEAVARGFAADLDIPVGTVDPGQVATDLSGGGGRDPATVAEMVLWALQQAEPSALDGAVLDWGDYRSATR